MRSGKAILAYLTEEELRAYFSTHSMEAFTDNTCTNLETLQVLLAQVRATGYSLDIEEFLPDVCCIGAPIFDANGSIAASIAISLPRSRYDIRRHMLMSNAVESG